MPPADSIFTSCRKGDLDRIKYLVEKREVDLNIRDCWDSTPLYYACHCGHFDVVQYLLMNGARCEANTFDGERCLYGALTDTIRRLLLDSKILNLSASQKRDEFDAFCEKMMGTVEYSDATISVGGQDFKAHRCLLGGRSEYFTRKLANRSKIQSNAVSPKAFDEFLKYIYTGRMSCGLKHCDETCQLADKCQVKNLSGLLKTAKKECEIFDGLNKRIKVSTLIVDSPVTRASLIADFRTLIDPGIPEQLLADPLFLYNWSDGGKYYEYDPFFDLCFLVEGHKFYCHRVFVCTRSEYFTALVQDHFAESRLEDGIPMVTLNSVKPQVLACVLYFIYTNAPYSLSENTVLDVLEAADIYLLPGLKRQCATYLCSLVSTDNIIDLLKISRMHDLPKLEDACAGFIGRNIDTIAVNEEFRKFVVHDAQEVQGRQETDSIPIIDDIRYHISSEIGTFSEIEDAQMKLNVIDSLLDDLNLEA